MDSNRIESGVQLFSRLNEKPFLQGINSKLFSVGGPYQNQVIEIVADYDIGNEILIDFIVRCILPDDYNTEWKGCGAVLINTEFQINLMKIIKIIETHIKNIDEKVSKKKVLEDSLKRLTFYNCYNPEDLEICFFNLERFIHNNDNVILVVLDNIAAHYWIAKLDTNLLSYYQHSLKIFESLYNATKDLNVLLVVMRHEKVDSKRKKSMKIDYKVEVQSSDSKDSYVANVSNYENQQTIAVPFNVNIVLEF